MGGTSTDYCYLCGVRACKITWVGLSFTNCWVSNFFGTKNTIKIRAKLNVIVAVSCNYFILVSWQQRWWLKEVTWFTSGVKRTTRASLVKLKKFITLTRRHIWLFRCYRGIKVNRYALRTCWYFRFPTPDSSFSDFPFLNFFLATTPITYPVLEIPFQKQFSSLILYFRFSLSHF